METKEQEEKKAEREEKKQREKANFNVSVYPKLQIFADMGNSYIQN